jgi:hypothetical protein
MSWLTKLFGSAQDGDQGVRVVKVNSTRTMAFLKNYKEGVLGATSGPIKCGFAFHTKEAAMSAASLCEASLKAFLVKGPWVETYTQESGADCDLFCLLQRNVSTGVLLKAARTMRDCGAFGGAAYTDNDALAGQFKAVFEEPPTEQTPSPARVTDVRSKTPQPISSDVPRVPQQGGIEENSLLLTGIRSWLQVADEKDSTTLTASQLTLEMMAGITFLANEECVDQLRQAFVLMDNHAQEMAWDFAIFMGCLISALFGGKWKRTGDGNYVLGEVGPKNIAVDIKRDILTAIQTDGSIAFRRIFDDVKSRSGS